MDDDSDDIQLMDETAVTALVANGLDPVRAVAWVRDVNENAFSTAVNVEEFIDIGQEMSFLLIPFYTDGQGPCRVVIETADGNKYTMIFTLQSQIPTNRLN